LAKNIFEPVESNNNAFGITENLAIDGTKLFCAPGGKKTNIIALNRITGELLWKSKGNEELNAYCSPIIIEHGGKKIYVTNTSHSLVGINIENGNLLWSSC
jgi:outer membrane protein assembly factor BamB